MKHHLTALVGLFFLFFSIKTHAQLTGLIMDSKGEPLPFANVYIEGSTRGTSANTEGIYTFDLSNGTYRIVFQSIGYKKKVESVEVKGKTTLNIQLESSDIQLSEFVVKSNAEDPAYPIIRKAMENRTFFRDQVKSYSADVYIKGVQKIYDAPKKFMGRDLGDMGGSIDTLTRSGILYLSETISKLNVDGSNVKEELTSAKVSGRDNGFGFNRATLFDFSFYQNTMTLTRELLSPISDNAFFYYKYHLVGTIKDKQGNDVYKIEVIPKRDEDPTWKGLIYIVDNQWNISATDLYITGKSAKQSVLDTLWLRQSFVPVEKVWRLFSQQVSFKFAIFSIKIKGAFDGVYSNYNLVPQYPKEFFSNEIFKATKQADDKNLSKWDSIRPIPLTMEERTDYIKKDSIQVIRTSKPYLDSVSKVRNKFTFSSLFFGYTYNNLWERKFISIGSPLTTFSFNPIQGGNISLDMSYQKRFGQDRTVFSGSMNVTPSVSYGFAEKKLRASSGFSYLFDRIKFKRLNLELGQKVEQFNEQNPISKSLAMGYALYGKEHYYKLYDKLLAKATYSQEIVNGLTGNIGFEAARRTPLVVNSQYSFKKKDDTYPSNLPEPLLPTGWKQHDVAVATIGLSWTPAQKYLSYPNYKDIEGSKYPTFSVRYQKGFGDSEFDKIRLRIEKDAFQFGLVGYSEIKVEYGSFLNKKNVQFIDNHHFNGNEIIVGNPSDYMNSFLQLPYYNYSTTNDYFMAHWQHNFEGFIFDKIPLISKLGFKEVIRIAYLNTKGLENYAELGFGIDNIGWGLFRLFRFDVNWQYKNSKFEPKPRIMIGFKIGL
jgi:hypothetical protein